MSNNTAHQTPKLTRRWVLEPKLSSSDYFPSSSGTGEALGKGFSAPGWLETQSQGEIAGAKGEASTPPPPLKMAPWVRNPLCSWSLAFPKCARGTASCCLFGGNLKEVSSGAGGGHEE